MGREDDDDDDDTGARGGRAWRPPAAGGGKDLTHGYNVADLKRVRRGVRRGRQQARRARVWGLDRRGLRVSLRTRSPSWPPRTTRWQGHSRRRGRSWLQHTHGPTLTARSRRPKACSPCSDSGCAAHTRPPSPSLHTDAYSYTCTQLDDGRQLRLDNARRYDGLVQALASHFSEYDRLCQAAVARERASVAQLRPHPPARPLPPLPAQQQQQQQMTTTTLTGQEAAARALADEVAAREAAVRRLEEDVAELALLFRDLQGQARPWRVSRLSDCMVVCAPKANALGVSAPAVVGAQQEQLDTIEANVTQAAQTSAKAAAEVTAATAAQRRSRKLTLWLICCLIVLVTIIAIAVAVPLARR
jgi:hypothetical protein